MEIIIEEINRGGKVLARHRFATEQVSIGRSYQNDIILSDPHICPEHIQFQRQGDTWIVTDLDSINGTFLGESKQNAHQHVLHSGDVLTLGKTQIRVVFPHHPVASSIKLSPFEDLIDLMRNPILLVISIGLFAFVAGFTFYLNQAADIKITQYIVRAIGATLMFAAWPAIVALVSHLTKNDPRILTQVGISFLFFNLMWILDSFEAVLLFNTSSYWSIGWFTLLLQVALAFGLFWLNGYIGFHFSRQRRFAVAFGLTVLLFGGQYLVGLSKKPDFDPRPHYNPVVLTPSFRFAEASDTDKFIADTAKLFRKTEKAAAKKDD